MLIAYFFSIRPAVLILVIGTVIALWRKGGQLPSIKSQTKIIIGVVFGTAVFFSFLLWYIYGDTGSFLGLVLTTAAVIIITVLEGGGVPDTKQEDETPFTIEDEILPVEEQQMCPNCGAIISQDATLCSWCGKSI